MILGNVKLENKTFLAPMAGVTDSSFRYICRKMGASLVFSEMISANGLIQNNRKTKEYTVFRQSERPIGFQLFGSDADIMAKAVEIAEKFQPDFIDINFGCPAKKVISKGSGSALLKDIDNLKRITDAVVKATSIPVLAKIRKGWDAESINGVEVAMALEQCGVVAITIHPRTKAEQFRGHSSWEDITRVKQAVSIPVIGNGDINTVHDAIKMFDDTGCDAIMIGRGALGNPWLFKQINHFLKTQEVLSHPSHQDRFNRAW